MKLARWLILLGSILLFASGLWHLLGYPTPPDKRRPDVFAGWTIHRLVPGIGGHCPCPDWGMAPSAEPNHRS